MRTSPKCVAFGGALLLAATTTMTAPALAADPVLLHAAGSLRLALTEVIAAYEPAAGLKVQARFGASGTLKDAIAKEKIAAAPGGGTPQEFGEFLRALAHWGKVVKDGNIKMHQ